MAKEVVQYACGDRLQLRQLLVVWISETKLDDFYHQGFADCYLQLYGYFLNVSADISFGLLRLFVELWHLHKTSNYVLFWIHGGRLFWFR